jgi:predicted methyltransferase/DNA-directed RNA polymerase subunit RPC12/RpoP
LEELAREVRLLEGPAGVERFLWAVAQCTSATTRHISQQLGIPVPVVSALRRELEKRGYLSRGKGMHLSSSGEELIRCLWGGVPPPARECPTCYGSGIREPVAEAGLIQEIENLCRQRPTPDVTLDQAHLEPRCLVRKANLLISQGCILGRRVLFLGDDDLLSLTVFLAAQRTDDFQPNSLQIEVIDLDTRVVEVISTLSKALSLPISARSADARNPLADSLRARFDTVITDPPYTLAALRAFLGRAEEALHGSPRSLVVLSFGRKSDMEQVQIQQLFCSYRLALRAFYPGFNRYLGAAVLGGASDLYVLARAPGLQGKQKRHPGGFYTVEGRKTPRGYRCLGCGNLIRVGPEESFTTIQKLKESGCPNCGKNRFRYS